MRFSFRNVGVLGGPCLVMIICMLCIAVTSCQRTPPSSRAVVKPKDPRVTELSYGGCSIRLPGKWTQTVQSKEPDSLWGADIEDGSEALSVLPMNWEANIGIVSDGIQELITLRRGVDKDESGAQVQLSDVEVLSDSAWYTAFDPANDLTTATMVKASRKVACVFLLTLVKAERQQFSRHAKWILENATASP